MAEILAPDAIPFSIAYEAPVPQIIQDGYGILKLGYFEKVKPEAAYFARCNYTKVERRHLALCGINYGGPGLAQRAHWEIINEKNIPTLLAMNDEAISALNKIVADNSYSKYANFRMGMSERPPIPPTAFANIFPKK